MVLGLFSSQIDLWFFIGFIGMAAATCFPAYRYWKEENHLRFYLSQMAITGIAMTAYILMYLGIGVFTYNGTEVVVTRYVDWMLTTPVMVSTLAALSKPGEETVIKLVLLDILVMSMGAIGPFIGFPLYWVTFGLGGVAYATMVYMIMGEVSSGPGLENERTRILFTKLRNLTVVLWVLYPVVVFLAPQALGVLNQGSEAMVIAYLDIISKGFFVVTSCRGAGKIKDISFDFELN